MSTPSKKRKSTFSFSLPSTQEPSLCLVYIGSAHDVLRPCIAIPNMKHLICIDTEPAYDACIDDTPRRPSEIIHGFDYLDAIIEGKYAYDHPSRVDVSFNSFKTEIGSGTSKEVAKMHVAAGLPTRLIWTSRSCKSPLSMPSYQIDYFCNQSFPDCMKKNKNKTDLSLKSLLAKADGLIIGGYFPHHSIWNMLSHTSREPIVYWMQNTFVPRSLQAIGHKDSVVHYIYTKKYIPSEIIGIQTIWKQIKTSAIQNLNKDETFTDSNHQVYFEDQTTQEHNSSSTTKKTKN